MTAQNFTAILLNLDRDTTRLDHMQKQLAQAGITFVRQPGILGDAVPEDLRSYFYDASGTPKTTMKRGEIGCYASHLRALEKVARGDEALALIMEDDLALTPDLIDVLAGAQQAMPSSWDILRLSSPPRRAYKPIAALGGDRLLIAYSKIPNSAGAYLVTRKGAEKFLRDGVRGLTFDDDLRRPWFHNMETYGIMPSPIEAGVTHKSTIDSIEPGRFDKGMSSRRERLVRGDHFHALKRAGYNMRILGLSGWIICAMINFADMIVKPVTGRSLIDPAARLFFPKR